MDNLEDLEAFGRWLRESREVLDLTREQFAGRVGCAPITITKIERGQRRPSRQIAERLADVLELSPEDKHVFVQWARGLLSEDLPRLPIAISLKARDRSRAQFHAQQPASVLSPATSLLHNSSTERHANGNLPAIPSTFVGRSEEVARLSALLPRMAVRLLTLIGPAGVGKTRLSVEVAYALRNDFEHGAWFVPLAPLDRPEQLVPAIARTLGLAESPRQPIEVALREHLVNKHILLVLDNFEHIMEAASQVAELLAGAPGLKLLVTSREVLRVYGEHRFPLSPLSLPDLSDLPQSGDLTQYASVALFAHRAQAADPDFSLEESGRAVAEICVALEGLPLAIELAAARVAHLPVEQITARLADRLGLLTGGPRDHPIRQRTLRDAISWSYDLLSSVERDFLSHLAIFTGGFSSEAASIFLGNTGSSSGAMLSSLVDKSLVLLHDAHQEPRFDLLEMIKEYGLEQLREKGEEADARGRHAIHYMELAERADNELSGPAQLDWLRKLDSEHDNVRSALEWSATAGDLHVGLRLAGALWRFWLRRGHLAEGRAHLSKLLSKTAPDNEIYDRARAKALFNAGRLASSQGDEPASHRFYLESLELSRKSGDKSGMAYTLLGLSKIYRGTSDIQAAVNVCREALDLWRELENKHGMAISLISLGTLALEDGDAELARRQYEQALTLSLEEGDRQHIASSYSHLGLIANYRGEYVAARTLFEQGLAIYREIGNKLSSAWALRNIGRVAYRQGDLPTAIALLQESVQDFASLSNSREIATSVSVLALLFAEKGDASRAARLLGFANALLEVSGIDLERLDLADYELACSISSRLLDSVAWSMNWDSGRAMSLADASAEALANI